MRIAGAELDPPAFELRRDGTPVEMEPQVFDVLRYLAERAGELVTKEQLLDDVWGDRFVSESALTSRIKLARKACGDSGREQRIVKTMHGRGYRLVAGVVERRGDRHVRVGQRDVLAHQRDRHVAALGRQVAIDRSAPNG